MANHVHLLATPAVAFAQTDEIVERHHWGKSCAGGVSGWSQWLSVVERGMGDRGSPADHGVRPTGRIKQYCCKRLRGLLSLLKSSKTGRKRKATSRGPQKRRMQLRTPIRCGKFAWSSQARPGCFGNSAWKSEIACQARVRGGRNR